MSQPEILVLARHCSTAGNEAGLVLGKADPTLSDRGCRQARAIADWFSSHFHELSLASSPSRRAVETAKFIGDAFEPNLAPITDARLREREMGEFDGLTTDAMIRRRHDLGHDVPLDPTVIWSGVAGVEQDDQIFSRAMECIEVLLMRRGVLGIVTHAGVIRSLLHGIFGIDVMRPYAFHARLGSAFVLVRNHGLWGLTEVWQNVESDFRFTS